jgi:hypothetical protein
LITLSLLAGVVAAILVAVVAVAAVCVLAQG